MDINVEGRKKPKKRWLYPIKNDMRTVDVSVVNIGNRVKVTTKVTDLK